MMNIWIDLWEFFFPRCCVVCEERLARSEEFLCFKCLSSLPRSNTQINKEMEKGLWGKIPVERAHSFLYYTKGGDVRKLLYELKYYRNPKIGHYLGRCMAEELVPTGFFDGIDYIIPVPLHKKKQETRGYNQSEQLAAGISSVVGCEVLDNVLIRVKQTDTQTRKGHYERWINVKDVFDYVPSRDLSGKHILLLDDVFTTGATIVACADVLKQIPDLRISVLTLALAGEN